MIVTGPTVSLALCVAMPAENGPVTWPGAQPANRNELLRMLLLSKAPDLIVLIAAAIPMPSDAERKVPAAFLHRLSLSRAHPR